MNLPKATMTVLSQHCPKMRKTIPGYKNRQEVLADFVKQINVIVKNDSLLHLSTLPEDSVLSIAISILEIADAKEKKEKGSEKAGKKDSNQQPTKSKHHSNSNCKFRLVF